MRTVILIVRHALWAFHARLNLSSNAHAITWLDSLDFCSNSQDLANDLVANADGEDGDITPASSDCVDI